MTTPFNIDFTKTLKENVTEFNEYAREQCMRVDYYYTDLALIVA